MRISLFTCCLGIWLAAVVHGAELVPALTTAPGAVPLVYLAGTSSTFDRVTGDCGPVSRQAMLTTFTHAGVAVAAALDYSRPGLPLPDRIRFNFTGKKLFSLQESCALLFVEEAKRPGMKPRMRYSGAFDIVRLGQQVTVNVAGEVVFATPVQPTLSLNVFASATRPCAFGDRTCAVTVIDGNANLLLGDAPGAFPEQAAPGETLGFAPGDLVFVQAVPGARGAYRQPIRLDNAWYQVTLSDDAAKMSAVPVAHGVGTVKVEQAGWHGIFIGANGIFQVFGDAREMALPPDTYHLAYLDYLPPGQAREWQASLISNISRQVTVTAEETAVIPLYTGARSKLTASEVANGEVTFGMEFTDATGAAVDVPTDLPCTLYAFEVLNDRGQRVWQGSFQLFEETTTTPTREPG